MALLTKHLLLRFEHGRMKKWLFLLLLPLSTAAADEQASVRRAVEEGRLRPLAEIIAAVQARYPGRVVEVDLERRSGGRYVYEIELLSPERRKLEIKVDGATGKILETEGVDARAFLSLPVLLRHVLEAYPGHVIDVEFEHGLYRVEVAGTDGTHLQVSVDPHDGSISRDAARDADLSRMLPMPEALEGVLKRYRGVVLEGELERSPDGGQYYEFEIQGDDGDITTLHVDAFSGEVLREDAD